MKEELEKAAKDFQKRKFPFLGWDGIAAEFRSAFQAGAEWQAKQSPWISVEERLPDTDNGQSLCDVLVKMNDGRYYVAANVSVERLAEISEITHWAPIPE